MAEDTFILGIKDARRRRTLKTKADLGKLDEVEFNDIAGPYTTAIPIGDPRRKGVLLMEQIEGEGTFVSMRVSKRDGTSADDTTVFLFLDDKLVVNMGFGKAKDLDLKDRNNPYGIVLHRNSGSPRVLTMTVGFGVPLHFNESLLLFVKVQEPKVKAVESEVIFGFLGTGGGGDPTGTPTGPENDFP